ncbi:MAG: PAS domain S-box protein [Chromatiales bacterium]|nr:PAS domain S-box protein [Chromatiales bacterium]
MDDERSFDARLRSSHISRRARRFDDETLAWERDLFVGGPVAVLVWRPESRWPVCHASPNVAPIFGHSAERMMDSDFHYMSVIHPDDVDRIAGEVVRYLNEGRDTWEQRYRIVRPDGRMRWLYDFTIVDRDDSAQPRLLRGYVMDETETQRREYDFQVLAASIDDAIWISAAPIGLLYANPAALRLTGHDATSLGSLRWSDLIAPREHARLPGLLERLDAGESIQTEVWMRRRDRTEVLVDLGLQPLDDGRCLGIGRGRTTPRLQAVAKRRLPQDALSESQEFYRAIIDQAADGIVLIDAKTLRFVEFNEAACQSLGYSRTEFARLGIADIQADLSPHGIARWRERINSSGQGDFETCHRHKSGELRHVWVSNRALDIRQGRYWAAIWRDITERKRIDDELEEHRRHLEELVRTRTAELERARLEAESANLAKSILLANMSHEVRASINAILGLNHRLKASAEDPEQSRRLGQISEAGYHLLRVANDILDLSRMEAGTLCLERVDFELRHSLARLNLLLNAEVEAKGLRLRLVMDPTLPARLHGDPGRLGQILLNLAGNAVKFSQHGTVTVKANLVDRHRNRLRVRFEVCDEGVGIPEDRQDALFLAFEQLDVSTARQFGGSGLGLAISKRLVELMEGEIGVESRPGVGSTFWFTAWFGLVADAD